MWDQFDRYAVARYDNFQIESVANASANKNDYFLRISGYRVVPGEREAGDALGRYDGVMFGSDDRRIANEKCYTDFGKTGGW